MVACCDEQGIMQVNNLHSGNLLMSLTNVKNKMEISTIYFVDKGKIYIAAGCADGSVIFFLKPNHQTNKDYHTDDLVKSVIKKNVHKGAINIIRANSEFLAMGG